jgi:hypothetical protein
MRHGNILKGRNTTVGEDRQGEKETKCENLKLNLAQFEARKKASL